MGERMGSRTVVILLTAALLGLAVAGCSGEQGAGEADAQAQQRQQGDTRGLAQKNADVLAIEEVAYRFENTFDDGDFDAHMQTWTEEMSWRSPFGDYDDPQAYREWLEGFYDFTQEEYGGTRHLITNFEIDLVDGDTATMRCYLTVLGADGERVGGTPNRAFIAGTSEFEDRLEKVNGEWKFAERTLVVDQEVEQ